MKEELGTDIIDGKIINWDKMSEKELKEMKKKLKAQEKEIINKINMELES